VRGVENGGRDAKIGSPHQGSDDADAVLCKTTAAWAKGSTATLQIWTGEPGSETNTGVTLSAYNRIAAFKSGDPLTPRLRLWFGCAWFDVPTIAQCMEWSLDGVAETPDGSRVEPDATDSWLTLLGVV
jgi:hypothetical protein